MSEKVKLRSVSNIKKTDYKWTIIITIWTFFLSVSIQLFSSSVMPAAHLFVAVLILAGIVAMGILFDIVGVAVTAANETPFHAMNARKVRGAREAIFLIRNAEKVANFCNDVVGDIAGIVSGAAAALIVAKLVSTYNVQEIALSLVVTGFVASLTVGGKAMGKSFAIRNANGIIYQVSLLFYFAKQPFSILKRQGKNHRKEGR